MRGLGLRSPAFVGGLMLNGKWEYIEETNDGQGTFTTTYTVATPPNTQAGDLLVMFAAQRQNATAGTRTMTTPTGWTRRDYTHDNQNNSRGLEWRIADGTEAADYAWTYNGSTRGVHRIMLFRGGGSAPDPFSTDAFILGSAVTGGAGVSASEPTVPAGENTLLWCIAVASAASASAVSALDLSTTGGTVTKLARLTNISVDTNWAHSYVFVESVTPAAVAERTFTPTVSGDAVYGVIRTAPRL